MKKMFVVGGILGAVGLATASQVSDTFNIEVNIPDYCRFSSNLNEDIEFEVRYFNGNLTHLNGPRSNNFQFECVEGSIFTISATSQNGGKVKHVNDQSYYINYQLETTIYDSNYNQLGTTPDILNGSITATATDQNLNLGINTVLLTSFPPNPLAGVYTDTVTLTISY